MYFLWERILSTYLRGRIADKRKESLWNKKCFLARKRTFLLMEGGNRPPAREARRGEEIHFPVPHPYEPLCFLAKSAREARRGILK